MDDRLSTMKKVLFIVKRFPPSVGGVERHVYSVCKALNKSGYIVHIITSEPRVGKMTDNSKLIIHYVKDPQVKYLGILYIWIQFILKIRLFINSDIVHVHDIMIWVIPIRMILFWKKFYLTMHGWEGEYPIPLKNIIIKRLSDMISTATISVGAYIDKYYGTHSDIIMYGAASNNYSKEIQKRKEIVYLGRLDKDTGLPILLESLKKRISYKCIFVGDGELRDECLEYGFVTGMVKNPEDYIEKADIVIASGYLSIIESLQQKCFVICFYDNELKKDYYKLSPFSKYITTIRNDYQLQKLLHGYKRSKYIKVIEEAHQFASSLTWDRTMNQYLHLWKER